MGFWQLGNTSVRSAMRIKDALTALSTSAIQGNIRKTEGDIAFRKLLGECGVVSLGEDMTHSLGRKWRAAMGKLGFIYPKVDKSFGFEQEELGPLDMITPAGWNLVRAETVAAIQECFLRAMATPLFPAEGGAFSPLCWVLSLLLELEKRGEEPAVSFIEMAVIVQATTAFDGTEATVDRILALRADRQAAERKRVFDREIYQAVAAALGCSSTTISDYADMNIRYVKASGMVQSKGKGIALIPEKRGLAVQLAADLLSTEPRLALYRSLCNGRKLPTDNEAVAYQVLKELLDQIQHYGITYSIEGKALDTAAHINQARYEIEELIGAKKEEVYADKQAQQWREIAAYMDLIASRKDHMRLGEETDIRIPRAEAPAYFEWSLWRAFLAVNGLVNKPYQVRRFKIDQDFFPVSTAPGNGPDLIAEFEDCVIVVEVTLTESSRQEAMEGEPVRRHVADLMLQYNKPVYGLFIANRVDSNTAETFRMGVWYARNDERMDLCIVPLTLTQFSAFFKSLFMAERSGAAGIKSLLTRCLTLRNKNADPALFAAPQWKTAIASTIASMLVLEPVQ